MLGVGANPAGAAVESKTIRLSASINGRDVDRIGINQPLRLESSAGATVKIRVSNKSADPVTIRIVRLHGKVMGLTFYTYDTQVDMRLDPGETDEREFLVDLSDLGDQATGLLPGQLTLLDEKRRVAISDDFPVDVRGSLGSVYGIFGLVVAAMTGLLLIAALIRLVTNRLPFNRWSRATRFCIPGVGVGLILTFSLSALRVFTPSAGKWFPLVLIGGAAGFVIGYFTPTPDVRYVRQEVDADVDA